MKRSRKLHFCEESSPSKYFPFFFDELTDIYNGFEEVLLHHHCTSIIVHCLSKAPLKRFSVDPFGELSWMCD